MKTGHVVYQARLVEEGVVVREYKVESVTFRHIDPKRAHIVLGGTGRPKTTRYLYDQADQARYHETPQAALAALRDDAARKVDEASKALDAAKEAFQVVCRGVSP